MYLSRGTAKTTDGNEVKFLQAIPALKNQQALGFEQGEVAGLTVQAQDQAFPTSPANDETLKFGTFLPEQRVTPLGNESCVPTESQLSPIISLGALGNLGKWTIDAPLPSDVGDSGPFRWFRSQQWYLVPASAQVLPAINEVTAAFDNLPLNGRGSNLRDLSALQKEWDKYNLCPLRVSGGSPWLIFYGDNDYNVNVGRKLTYSYPKAENNSWNVKNTENKITVNGKTTDSIYYDIKP